MRSIFLFWQQRKKSRSISDKNEIINKFILYVWFQVPFIGKVTLLRNVIQLLSPRRQSFITFDVINFFLWELFFLHRILFVEILWQSCTKWRNNFRPKIIKTKFDHFLNFISRPIKNEFKNSWSFKWIDAAMVSSTGTAKNTCEMNLKITYFRSKKLI